MREMKDSGIEWIGKIPNTKKILRNKYIFSYIKGKLPANTNTEKIGFPYVGASDLDSNMEYIVYTEDDSLPGASYDDLLVLWDGARAGLAGTNKCGKISSTIVKITADESVFPRFLYWYYKGFEDYMYQCVNGTTIPHMNKKYIEDIAFLDWSIDEQQEMVSYLDEKCSKIDAVIEKQQIAIQKLKEYKLSLITEAVTKGLDLNVELKDSGIRFIGYIPHNWTVSKLKYMSLAIGDGIHGTPEYDSDGEIYFVNGNNIGAETLVFKADTNTINETEFKKYKKSLLNDNTILMTLNGATYGKTSFYSGEEILLGKSAGYITLKPNENKEFVRYYLQSTVAKLIMDYSLCGSTIANVSLRTLNDFTIPYPPKAEQLEIVSYLDKHTSRIDKSINCRQSIVERLIEYKKSLIYEVVTGKKEV